MDFFRRLNSGRPVIWDGAFGTNASRILAQKKIRPPRCNELLNIEQPQIVEQIHREFIDAGAEVIETNTFGATRTVLAENNLDYKFAVINTAAVRIAKRAANHGSRATSHEVLISASFGPTSKLPTLGHISFDEMSRDYQAQAKLLASLGVDIFQVETCQDILQTKAAIVGIKRALNNKMRPIVATVTVERNGTTLLGSDIGAAFSAIAPLGVAAFGLNCATGPSEMEPFVKELARICPLPIMILPNAGLPQIKNGQAFYPLSPKEFADELEYFVKGLGVAIVGGCCGTTFEHIREASKRLAKAKVRPRRIKKSFFVSSLFNSTDISQKPAPLIVGERMNINGSKEFRELLLHGDLDAAARLAKKQAASGAHMVDLNVAFAGRDEQKDISELAKRVVMMSTAPVMIDSTEPAAMEAALKRLSGRSVINSINLESGEAKAAKIIGLAKEFGAGLVALTIDNSGMAKTCSKKLSIVRKLVSLCKRSGFVKSGGFLFIDPLTFTLADPQAAKAGSALETLNALKKLKQLKKELPWIRTILGISNISYGLKPDARKILNSAFLHEAVKRGLDAAIVNPSQIVPLHKIDKKAASLAQALLSNKNKSALENYLRFFEGASHESSSITKTLSTRTDGDRLFNAVIDGDVELAKKCAPQAAASSNASKVINSILLPAMQRVGEMFGRQELALPFVLQSAEAMRAAIDSLSSFIDGEKKSSRGKIVLATVRGDVHDIGKNLVDIILSNNGFSVVNLGVKQPVDAIANAVRKERPDAIGLSGLLVQSCLVMKDDLAEMAKRGIDTPVICGGAALTETFVKNELKKAYAGEVFFARDAFDGLKIMQRLRRKK